MNNSSSKPTGSRLSGFDLYRSGWWQWLIWALLFTSLAIDWSSIYYRYFDLTSQLQEKIFVESCTGPRWIAYLYLLFYLSVFFLILFIFVSGKINWPRPVSISVLLYGAMWLCAGYLLVFLTKDPLPYLTKISQLSSKLAPGTLLVIGLFFIGANPFCWAKIPRIVNAMAWVCIALVVVGVCKIDFTSRFLAMRYLNSSVKVLGLVTLVPFAFYSLKKKTLWFKVSLALPVLAMVVCGVFTQTRLYFVVLGIYLFTYFLLSLRRAPIRQSVATAGTVILIAFGCILLAIASYDTILKRSTNHDNQLLSASVGLVNRIDEDTRTYQYSPDSNFFQHFWNSFPWGAGYPSEDQYNGEGLEGIDNGYLNGTYIAGLPMMTCFFFLLCVPVLRSLFLKLNPLDSAIVAGAFTYVCRLGSSTVIVSDVQLVIFVLFAGRCAYLVSNERNHQV